MSVPTLATFITAVLVLQLSPGPDMLFVIAKGIGSGRRSALMSAIGGTVFAGAIQVPLLALGVASLFANSPAATTALRYSGAAYLFYLGIKLLMRSVRPAVIRSTKILPADGSALRQGLVNNLTNPKALVFMLVFLPQFVDPAGGWPVPLQLLVLGSVQKITGFAVLVSIALCAGSFGSWLSRHPSILAWQDRFTGLAMIAIGLRLATQGSTRALPS